jgi:hypothetical protein
MRLLSLAGLLLLSATLVAQPEFKFEEKKQKFEEVKAGAKLSFDFSFSNKGNQPLIINDIKVSCECTKFEYPQKPVAPGEKENIHVTFDTKEKTGWQYRDLIIHSNAKGSPNKIQFFGKVIPIEGATK